MPKKRGRSGGDRGIVPVQCADKASEEEMAPPQSHWAAARPSSAAVVARVNPAVVVARSRWMDA